MPCCLIAAAAFFPRIVLFVLWLTNYTEPVFETYLWPLLGFFFMPFTTCAYAIGVHERGDLGGWALLLVIIGVFLDISSWGGGERFRRKRYRRLKLQD